LKGLLYSIQVEQESEQPIAALFTEFPSNPLLESPNLLELRKLADQYGFLIVIDDTIGNCANVCVIPYADLVVTSLTKLFSGEANATGGRSVSYFVYYAIVNNSLSFPLLVWL
jgi:cystathionine gamma-synthase